MSDRDRESPPDTPERMAEKLRHAEQLRMWHLRQGPYADPKVPPPVLKPPKAEEG